MKKSDKIRARQAKKPKVAAPVGKKKARKPKKKALVVEGGDGGPSVKPAVSKNKVGRPRGSRKGRGHGIPARAQPSKALRNRVLVDRFTAAPITQGYVDGCDPLIIEESTIVPGMEHLYRVPLFDINAHGGGVPEDPYAHPYYTEQQKEDGTPMFQCRWEGGPFTWKFGDCHDEDIPSWDLPEWDGEEPGPRIPNLSKMGAAEVMSKFVPNHFWEMAALETNAYRRRWEANERQGDEDQELDPMEEGAPYDIKWEDLTLGSMLRWVGLNLGMTIEPKHRTQEHWRKEQIGVMTPDSYGAVMSRNRYNLVRKFFYLNHAEPDDHVDGRLKDKFHKVRPMLELVNGTIKKNWCLSRFVVIDEMMWPYGGKFCPARSYMPSKPDKFGIKAWALNDHHTGYLYDFWPYGGKGDVFPTDTPEILSDFGHGERTCIYHTRDLRKGSVLFTDSHFTSPVGFAYLKDQRGIFACGTSGFDRKWFPHQELHWLDKAGTERGFWNWAVDASFPIACVSWKDTKLVNLVSTAFPPTATFVTRGHKTADLCSANSDSKLCR
mmetsp:Transcript_17433/g.22606  ORF Transcript_17433/g.22606 Transcript_17433/m.22606 type:complete len:549 (+) Transcript_17433:828-2474(+)